jgi:hypothetical protein
MWTHFLPNLFTKLVQHNVSSGYERKSTLQRWPSPEYTPSPHLFQNLIQNPHAANHPQVAGMLANILPPSPQYTCPVRRAENPSIPVLLQLKAIVIVVTAATGESGPWTDTTTRTRWRGTTTTDNVWYAFFKIVHYSFLRTKIECHCF